MRLRDALRLKAGDVIAYGDSQWTRQVELAGSREIGTVRFVTRNGGVHVQARGSKEPKWIPYTWVIRKLKGSIESHCFD